MRVAEQARALGAPRREQDARPASRISAVEQRIALRVEQREGVERDAGNFTYRVAFDDAAVDDPRWHQLLSTLGAYECWFDLRDPGFLAISAPPQHAQAVAEELYAREQRGELGYETGRS